MLLLSLLLTVAAAPQPRDGTTAYVNFANDTGPPCHLAAGFLYGIPDTPNQIPAHFYKNMGFNYERAGGSQLPPPARGWIWGIDEYKNRFQSVKSNYFTTKQHGAKFIFLPADLWGADGSQYQNSSAPFPGDNGDWSYYDDYLEHVFRDFAANGMDEIIWDIWNEPDGNLFWKRSQQQYLEMWGRSYPRIEQHGYQTSGPSTAFEPGLTNDWWTNYASFVSTNRSIPDQYTWHMETGQGSMPQAYGGLQDVLSQYNLPQRLVNINEYAVFDEQVPCGSAWWISGLERVNAHGLRGNWLDGLQLHDFFASLLSKPGAPGTYSPTGKGSFTNGDYQVYQYYTQSMTGRRAGTTISSDYALDAYATFDKWAKRARILVGVRLQTGTWYLQLDNLSALGLPTSGSLDIHTYGFPFQGHWGEVDAPNDLGYVSHSYSGDSVTFPIFQTDQTTAYAFDFALP